MLYDFSVTGRLSGGKNVTSLVLKGQECMCVCHLSVSSSYGAKI